MRNILAFGCLSLILIVRANAQTNNFPLYSYGSYSGGTGDYTDISNAQLRLQSTSSTYIRVPFVSSHGTVSTVFNFETGKHVFWGEPADAGTYWFRGRNLNIEQGQLLIPNGQVGIGTTSPGAWFPSKALEMYDVRPVLKLNSSVATGLSTIMFTNSSINGTTHYGEFHLNFGYNQGTPSNSLLSFGSYPGGTVLAMQSDGNVGIGTTSPSVKFDIQGSGSTDVNLKVNGRIQTGDGAYAGGMHLGTSGNLFMGQVNASSLGFYNNGLWRLIADNNGNVGVGTISPSATLDIQGSGNTNVNLKINGRIQTGDAANAGGMYVGTGGMFMGQVNANALGLWNNGAWRLMADNNGNVGIGTLSPNQKLTVNGTIYGKEVKVDLNVPGPDYVFEKDYKLPSLDEIKSYIDANKHLPEVPSAKEMEEKGINVGEMNMILLKKVEELTLLMIGLQRQNEEIRNELNQLKNSTSKQ